MGPVVDGVCACVCSSSLEAVCASICTVLVAGEKKHKNMDAYKNDLNTIIKRLKKPVGQGLQIK